MILLRDAFVFHAYEPLDFRLPETSIAILADLLDNLLVLQIYSHRHHSQDMDEALLIPHLAVGHILRENPALERVHGLVLTSRALLLTASLYHELIFASSHLELSEGGGYCLFSQHNGELVCVIVRFHTLTNLKGLALAVLHQIFSQPQIFQVWSKTRSTKDGFDFVFYILVSVSVRKQLAEHAETIAKGINIGQSLPSLAFTMGIYLFKPQDYS